MVAKTIYDSDSFIGKTYNRLTAIEYIPNLIHSKQKHKCWLFKCSCGKEHITELIYVVRGKTKSCGCLPRENFENNRKNSYVHGMFKSMEYSSWQHMKARCYQKNHKRFKSYGGRGIKVCDEWKDSFESFLNDMGKMPENCTSIERIDVNGDYCKNNCKWDTDENQRLNKSNTLYVLYNGSKIKLIELCKIVNVPYPRTRQRIYLGWNIQDALFTPMRK